MADNTTLNTGTGGDVIATDDIAGVKFQRVKLIHGADGVNAGDVSTANPLPVGDAGGTLTVDDGGLTLSVDDGAGSLTVDNAALSTTGGGTEAGALRVTIASDSTGLVSVDDNGGSLTVDGSVTTAPAVNTTSGTLGALNAAVTRAFDGAGAGVHIGSGLVGTVAFEGTIDGSTWSSTIVRLSSGLLGASVDSFPTSVTFLGGPFASIRARVSAYTSGSSSAWLVTNGAAPPVVWIQGFDATDSPLTAFPMLAGAYASTSAPGAVDADGDAVRLWADRSGRLQVGDGGATLSVDDGAGSLTVDSAQLPAALVGGRLDVVVGAALPAGTNNIGDVDVLTVPAPLSTTGGGTEATALRVTVANDSTGVLSVDDNGGALTVDNGGTFPTQETGAALTALQLIDDCIVADDAAFTVATTKVAMSGGYCVAHGANPDAADAGDAGAALMNRHRVQFVIGGHPNAITRSVRIADADNAQTDVSIAGTINAGTKVVVTALSITCDASNTNPVACKIGFGATTIPADSTTGAAGVLFDHEGIAAGSGVAMGNGGGILGVGADGEELRMTCEDPVGGFICVTFTYFTIES